MTNRNTQGVITIVDGYSAASQAVNEIGPRYGSVVLAPLGTGITAFQIQGPYAGGTAYVVNDVVGDVGIAYICIQAGTGHTPASSPLYWTPLAGDSTRINAVYAACPGKYAVTLGKGLWVIDSPLLPWSNLHVEHDSGATLFSPQVPGSDTAFVYNFVYTATGTGVLAGPVTVGQPTFTSTTSFAVGSKVWIGQTGIQYVGSQYVIRAKAGGPTYTYTVDRGIAFAFPVNESVKQLTVNLENFTLCNNKALICGTANRLLRFEGARSCIVKDLRLYGYNLPHGMSWDLGHVDCMTIGEEAYGVATGVQTEAGERDSHYDVKTDGCTTCVRMFDTVSTALYSCDSEGDGATTGGISMASNSGNTPTKPGCSGVKVFGGRHRAHLTGVNAGNADGIVLFGTECEDCGVSFSFSSAATRCTFNSTFSRRASHSIGTYGQGYLIQGDACRLVSVHSVGDYQGIFASGTAIKTLDIVSPDVTGATACAFVIYSDITAAKITVSGGILGVTGADLIVLDWQGGATLYVDGTTLALGTYGGGGAFGIFARAGAAGYVTHLRDVQFTQAGANGEAWGGTAATTVKIWGYIKDGTTFPLKGNLGGSMCNYMSAAPTSATAAAAAVGDIVWNNAPAAGSPLGWVCTVAGAPGTWKTMANLT